MAFSNYSSGPGGFNLTTEGPGGGGPVSTGFDDQFFRRIAARKAAIADQERAAAQQERDRSFGLRGAGLVADTQGRLSDLHMRQAAMAQKAEPVNDPGEATYVKPVGGFNMSPGMISSGAGPGAVFAGYRPRGSGGPSSASFQPNFSRPSPASLPEPPPEEPPPPPDTERADFFGTGTTDRRAQAALLGQRRFLGGQR